MLFWSLQLQTLNLTEEGDVKGYETITGEYKRDAGGPDLSEEGGDDRSACGNAGNAEYSGQFGG